MSRPALASLGIGLSCLAGLAALAVLGGVAVTPSYLGAWLVLLAGPVGALPLVMGIERAGGGEAPILPALRRLLAVMPLAAALGLPVLWRAGRLYPALGGAKDGVKGWWATPTSFDARLLLALMVWTALALVFARSPRRGASRGILAGGGLMAHVVIGTLLAIDVVQGLEPAFTSSAFGLTLILAQAGFAVSLGIVLAMRIRPSAGPTDPRSIRHLALALVILLAVWGFLQFTQYLVVWSANLPRDVSWYRHRSAGLGETAEFAAGLVCALVLLALLPRRLAARADVLAGAAGVLAVLHMVEMLWLVTPAFRAEFDVTIVDLLALVGTCGLGLGTVLAFEGGILDRGRPRHGTA